MTNKQAIQILTRQKNEFMEQYIDYGNTAEAYDAAIAALENDEPCKPTGTPYCRAIGDGYYGQIWECGCCGENLPGVRFDTKFCPNCGRKIDWQYE